ncbi:MAG: MMPL family transporter [Lachnospiraceae bacterium]
MKKTANFLVDKRHIVFVLFLIFAIISLFLMDRVNVNYDMTQYLPEDSSMKQGMELMEEEFGTTESSTLRLMFKNLPEDEKQEVYDYLAGLSNVGSVLWEADSSEYNKEEYTLYEINMDFDSYSEECRQLFDTVTERYDEDYEIYTDGDISSANIPTLPAYVLVLAFAILMIILFLMCNSWFEPVVFLANIGIAIVINMGTNAFLPSISDTSNSVVAIMQLVLSMDYSIILMNRYTQEKENCPDNLTAMKHAIANAFGSITGSSLTTFVGLLALVFMSFKIGADMGIALAKSVVISLICIFTVLPSLILMSDKVIVRLRKKALNIPMGGYAKISSKFRYVFGAAFIGIFVIAFILKGDTEIMYALEEDNEVAKVFEESNTLVMLYSAEDSEKAGEIASGFENDGQVKSITGYYNTLGKEYTAEELTETLGSMSEDLSLDSSVINMIYYSIYGDSEGNKIPLSHMLQFILNIADSENYSQLINEEMTAQLQLFAAYTDEAYINASLSAEELSAVFGLDGGMVSDLLQMTGSEYMSMKDFVDFMVNNILTNSDYAVMFDEQSSQQLYMLRELMSMAGAEYTAEEFASVFSSLSDAMDENTAQLLYLLYESQNNSNDAWTMTLPQLMDYISGELAEDARFSSYIDENMVEQISNMKARLDDGIRQLEGSRYGRIIFETTYPEDSRETREFLNKLTSMCDEQLTEKTYFIGSSSMDYEMSKSFNGEMNRITIITAIAIFIVVMLTFKSLVIPLILVLVVQCGVFATMSIIGFSGNGMYYLALLIVQCILMGATIDYGILFTSYYKANRKTMDVRMAIEKSYEGSMHTILTSSMIMILVTAILGFVLSDPTIGEICLTISKGALCATVLIVFILPGVLACADKIICRKKNRK